MRCHYEVLGVPLDVDITALRKAYKALALRWHPDKNLDNADKAKEEFQLVQQAFEVLSDPQERSWYDNHREAILKGGFGDNYQDDSLNLFPYFSASCYQGYGDDEKGFYTVYREVFNKIYAEDRDFDCDDDDDDDSYVPDFGNAESSYDEVVHPFYAYWENYCTTKSFAWLDEFDVREAPNRRVLRLMEKQNKKARDKARKERNEEIRTLVKFVRKRDKRIQQYRKILSEKSAENAKKVELNRLRQKEERNREIAESKEAEWSRMENVEVELKEIEASLANEFGETSFQEDEEIDLNHLYCAACNKLFKNEKSFANHENSKKHKDNVAASLSLLESDAEKSDIDEDDDDTSDAEITHKKNHFEDEASLVQNGNLSSKKKAKRKKVLKPMDECVNSPVHDDINSHEFEENGFSDSNQKKQKRKIGRRKNNNSSTANTTSLNDAEDVKQDSLSEDRLKMDHDSMKNQKVYEKKLKGKKSLGKNSKTSANCAQDLGHTCAMCESTFPSKNKLFEHLTATGHAVYIPKKTAANKERAKFKTKDCS